MKPRSLFLLLVIVLLAACTATPAPTAEPVQAASPVLDIVGLDQTASLTLDDLQAMETTTGWGGTKSSAGVITVPAQLKGISLFTLTDLVGGLEPGMGVNIVAKDGYAMTLSYEQIANGDYITYDPGTGFENSIDSPLRSIIAYERDGAPIPSDEDGPLRLFVVSDANDNVVDGHWTVKWVSKIVLKPMSDEWVLQLEGVLTETVDRNSFESCGAPGCHQATWTDPNGDEWSGIPLYYLAGRVDDGTIHENRAYNDAFAKAGYTLQLFAVDGYNVAIESSRTDFNRMLFVASSVNGEPLPEDAFPLRLVGEGLDTKEMIGQLAQIIIQPNPGIDLPSAETEKTPEETVAEVTLPEGAVVLVHGKVMNQLGLGMANLESMNVVTIEAEHPKKGLQTYEGISLNALLGLAGIAPDAATLTITASDGFSAEVAISDVLACEDCLLAFAEDGTLSMVMPGMESNYWVKQVTFLEIK